MTVAASSKIVITHKRDPGNQITVEYNPTLLVPIIPQIQIFPGDTVVVPRAGIVYLVGNVVRPGVYVLEGRRRRMQSLFLPRKLISRRLHPSRRRGRSPTI